jgi:hypothetical protein
MGDERRFENRLLCAELVEVHWEEESGRRRSRVANLEDISLSGICLQMENEIRSGTRIRMQYGDGELVGVVRYCAFRGFGFFLGIELEEGSRWSSHHYRPEHLLDPQDLVERVMIRHQMHTPHSPGSAK